MDARESSFLAFVRAHQAQLQREALQLTGETQTASRLSHQALVRVYRHWTPSLSGSAAERLADRELAHQVKGWRRSGQAESLAARIDDPAQVSRYDPEPLDAEEVLVEALHLDEQRHRRRPLLAAGAVVVVLAVVGALLFNRAAIDEQSRTDGLATMTATSPVVVGPDESATDDVLTESDLPFLDVAQVPLDCGSSALGSGPPPEAVRVETDPGGVPVALPDQLTVASVSWSNVDPGDRFAFGGFGQALLGGGEAHVPIPPGRWEVSCAELQVFDTLQFSLIVEVTDPAQWWRGDLEQAGCLVRSPLERPGAFGATVQEAVDQLVELPAPVLVDLDTAGASLVRADAGYPEDTLPTYLAVLASTPAYVVELVPVVGGFTARPTQLCVQPGEPVPDRLGEERPGRVAPTFVTVSCRGDQVEVDEDRAVGARGLLVRTEDAGTTTVRMEGQGVSQERELLPAVSATPIPPGTVTITCLSGTAQGTSTTVELVDANGYWLGSPEQYGCTPEPLEDAPSFDLDTVSDDDRRAISAFGLPSVYVQRVGYTDFDSGQELVGSMSSQARFIWAFDFGDDKAIGTPVARCQ